MARKASQSTSNAGSKSVVPVVAGAGTENVGAITAAIGAASRRSAATALAEDEIPTAAPEKRKAYEVLGTINLGRKPGAVKPDIRTQGDTLFSDELPFEKIRELLKSGELADTDAPIPPSKAEGAVAFADLVDVAIAARLIKREGATYTFAGRDFRGISEFRANVTRDALKQALMEKVS